MNGMIHTREAAAMIGMKPHAFRRRYCSDSTSALAFIEYLEPRGVRRFLIRLQDMKWLLETRKVPPRGVRLEEGAAVKLQKAQEEGAA